MKRKHFLRVIAGIIATFILAAGAGEIGSGAAIAQTQTSILVSAAASLQDVLEGLTPGFEQANDTIQVHYNFGASGTLQRQIEQGAPADLFISAATKQMDALQSQNLLLTNTRHNLLTNQLVLIVPSNSTLGLSGFRQLTGANVQRVSVGEFRSVPAGQYAEEVLKNLGILEQVRSKLVYANNVRGVLAAVESGNADAGIVYATDAKISSQVKQVATAPESLHAPIVYPIAVLKASKNVAAAKTYVQYLSSTQARRAFEQFGFGVSGT